MDGHPTSQSNNSKHKWDQQEDAKLIECLLQLVESGHWRADNGTFRGGYLQQLERWMHEKMPNCQLRATPHISSRVKLWKKQYYALSEMQGASGFGWNDRDKCITCEQTVFEDWVKGHPTAKGLRGKSFPYLEEWFVVFGKDRANGLGVESPADAAENIEREEGLDEGGPTNVAVEEGVGLEDLVDSPVDETQTNISPTPTDGSRSRRTQKRRLSSADMLNDSISKSLCSMENMFGKASKSIAKLADCFQFMAEDSARKDAEAAKRDAEEAKRNAVSEELKKLPGLSPIDRIRAGATIVGDSNKINLYFSLPDDDKLEYVKWVLSLM